ncbi:HAMP domain-containing sensor histidine kinase [Priestia endophytica]|uniref:HAMP domain-containing sensor histidine kinase n=1 Tax=Priestia filamentosa TaxID=1402861 RepID=UPI003D2D911E
MPIKYKIYIFTTVTLLSLLLLANSAVYLLFNKMTTDSELERLQTQAKDMVGTIQPQDNLQQLLTAYLPPNGMIRVIDEDNKLVSNTLTKEIHFQKLPVTYQHGEKAFVREYNGEKFAVVYHPLIWTDGSIVSLEITTSLKQMSENLSALRFVLIGTSLLILIPIILASRTLGNIVLSPIQSLVQTMEEIQKNGRFKKLSLPKSSRDELYIMGKTFNNMMDILRRNFEKQQQFVSDASHELKTPLTVIESYASLLKRWGTKKPEVLEESIEAIHSEAVRMKEMTEQMLMLAQSNEQGDLQEEEVDVVHLVTELSQRLEHAYNRTIKVHKGEENMTIVGDCNKLKQLLIILLDNGLKYSEKHLDVSLHKKPNGITVSVQDYGIGIPQEDQASIFDRFYRVDKARNRKSGGTGLGLAIAKNIVEAHKGTLTFTSVLGEGSTFTIALPFHIKQDYPKKRMKRK